MELLLSTFATLTLLVIIVLIATRGQPMHMVRAAERFFTGLPRNISQICIIGLTVLIAGAFGYILYLYPGSNLGPEQPIPFSHRVHAGVKQIDCRFCHPYVARSNYPGLPPVQKCLFCHEYIIKDHPQIQKEHRYFNTDTPTPWVKANFLPEHVLFNHQRHIRKDVPCQECHGMVQRMDRIAGKDFQMGFCLDCHRTRGANIGCWLACHS